MVSKVEHDYEKTAINIIDYIIPIIDELKLETKDDPVLEGEIQILSSFLMEKPLNSLVDLLIFAFKRQKDPYSNDPSLHQIYSALLISCDIKGLSSAAHARTKRKSFVKNLKSQIDSNNFEVLKKSLSLMYVIISEDPKNKKKEI